MLRQRTNLVSGRADGVDQCVHRDRDRYENEEEPHHALSVCLRGDWRTVVQHDSVLKLLTYAYVMSQQSHESDVNESVVPAVDAIDVTDGKEPPVDSAVQAESERGATAIPSSSIRRCDWACCSWFTSHLLPARRSRDLVDPPGVPYLGDCLIHSACVAT